MFSFGPPLALWLASAHRNCFFELFPVMIRIAITAAAFEAIAATQEPQGCRGREGWYLLLSES
jgi:hypothetical protein